MSSIKKSLSDWCTKTAGCPLPRSHIGGCLTEERIAEAWAARKRGIYSMGEITEKVGLDRCYRHELIDAIECRLNDGRLK